MKINSLEQFRDFLSTIDYGKQHRTTVEVRPTEAREDFNDRYEITFTHEFMQDLCALTYLDAPAEMWRLLQEEANREYRKKYVEFKKQGSRIEHDNQATEL